MVVRRWKGFKTFMWWSAFSYNKKGPYYIWPTDTDAQKRDREVEARKGIAERNAARYKSDKAIWEAATPISRLRIGANYPGRKPVFRHNDNNGAYVLKDRKGGIN